MMAMNHRCGTVLVAVTVLAVLAGCASGPRSGRDGAPANPPAGLSQVPDAEPRVEPMRIGNSRPYTVLGRAYTPITDDRPLRETGLASWYGSKFHAQPTASGEPYDMYAMTGAHKTLPLPSYVRVRNVANGREVIVRVNDRGPFHDDRVIDLSYAAALKLDLLRGVAPVEIERITNEDIRTGAWRRDGATALAVARQPGAVDDVAVPMAMTSPVANVRRSEVRELPPIVLPPVASRPAGAAASSSAATPAAATPPMPGDYQAFIASQAAPAADRGLPASGFWIQLGAFSARDSAVSFQQQVGRSMPTIAPTLSVFSESGTHRLQAGPYASRDLARDTAEQVRNGLSLAPIIVERR